MFNQYTLPAEYRDMVADLGSSVYTDVVFLVYSDNKYIETTTRTPDPGLYQGSVAIYELNKAEQTSVRVY